MSLSVCAGHCISVSFLKYHWIGSLLATMLMLCWSVCLTGGRHCVHSGASTNKVCVCFSFSYWVQLLLLVCCVGYHLPAMFLISKSASSRSPSLPELNRVCLTECMVAVQFAECALWDGGEGRRGREIERVCACMRVYVHVVTCAWLTTSAFLHAACPIILICSSQFTHDHISEMVAIDFEVVQKENVVHRGYYWFSCFSATEEGYQ